MLNILPVPMQDELFSSHNEPPKLGGGKRIKTLKKLLEAHPEINEVWVDATENPIPRPREKTARKLYYSGKQGEHTIKSQLLTTKKLILHVSGNLPGKVKRQYSFSWFWGPAFYIMSELYRNRRSAHADYLAVVAGLIRSQSAQFSRLGIRSRIKWPICLYTHICIYYAEGFKMN